MNVNRLCGRLNVSLRQRPRSTVDVLVDGSVRVLTVNRDVITQVKQSAFTNSNLFGPSV